MEQINPNIQKERNEFESAMSALPESLQPLLLSGKSVADLAHLAKNIIQVVSGCAEIIELAMARNDYVRIQQSWGVFGPNLARLKKFVLDLIKYTRHYPIQKTVCNLNEIIEKALHSCQPLLNKHAVKIQLHLDKSISPVQMDADRMEETLVNLLIHALDNLPAHSGSISIQTLLLTNPPQIELRISDDGPALSDEQIRSLAEPAERSQNMCGTGFEIVLSKLAVEQHDGYMEIASTPPKGNQIHIYLPLS
ncbi:MAG TPA: ATP-binding protein [Anaerohalosphaeraceae bacterium]|nr:hypothetical protein [Phycisphaerae bacterium]HOK95358.1 ATP-binding protein [Anaerohalosphaeraceae bacterium]HOL31935.1 ATP-binding protein [Anaerohalosphaeraceae bacterium]HOM76446.1 ATP-binding protein [Anaerohalosphaeraceae bacterium]HPC64282.1 ATP-binding protein [Anaerohalosphaeraceae bacterium]